MTEDGSCSRYVVVRKVSLRRRHFKGTLKKKKKKPAVWRLGKRIPHKGNHQCKGPKTGTNMKCSKNREKAPVA